MPIRTPIYDRRFVARCLGRIPGGLLLASFNVAILAPLHHFLERRADRAVAPEYIDGLVSVLRGTEKILEEQVAEIKSSNRFFGTIVEIVANIAEYRTHPSIKSRERALLKRKQQYDLLKQSATPSSGS